MVPKPGAKVRIAVPVLPHVSNFDDLDPLEIEPDVEVLRVWPGAAIPGDCALVLLLGSKATIAGLADLMTAGFDVDIRAHLRRGGFVLGLCGGYQMLGRSISDPTGIEGPPGTIAGLGLLDVSTTLTPDKKLVAVEGITRDGAPVHGYEMHMGSTTGPDCERPFARLDDERPDGAVSADGRVSGTYLHGLFANDAQRAAWIARLGGSASGLNYEAGIEAVLDELAAHVEQHLDIDALLNAAR
jgi:adenosylcobyric acid synthase